MRELWVVMLCGLVACGSKPAPVEAPNNSSAPDCVSTGGAIARSLADEDTKDQIARASGKITERCSNDKWSGEAVSCLIAAPDARSVKECTYNHLTGLQADKLKLATAPLLTNSWSHVMKRMAQFKDQMCACKDATCAQQVSDDITKWSQEMTRAQREQPEMTEEDTKQAADIGEQMGKCMMSAMGAGQPAAAPVPLTVTGLDPPKGDIEGGTYVRITGTGFTSDGPRNVKVYFGARQGTVVRFASDTELIVEAPGGKAKQTVDVLLIFDPGGELKLPKAFTFVKK